MNNLSKSLFGNDRRFWDVPLSPSAPDLSTGTIPSATLGLRLSAQSLSI